MGDEQKPAAGDEPTWKHCRIGSCHRHQKCMYRPCRNAANLADRLSDEADLCRNDGADDIADLLDEAREALSVQGEPVREVPADFISAILHGDDTHRQWLLDAAEAYISGRDIPPPSTPAVQSGDDQVKAVAGLPEYGSWLPDAWDSYMRDLVGWAHVRRWTILPATFRWHEFHERLLDSMAAMSPSTAAIAAMHPTPDHSELLREMVEALGEDIPDFIAEARIHADDMPRCIQRDYLRNVLGKLERAETALRKAREVLS